MKFWIEEGEFVTDQRLKRGQEMRLRETNGPQMGDPELYPTKIQELSCKMVTGQDHSVVGHH